LHISQPTISRDIDFIRNQSSSAAKTKDIAYRYYHEQQTGLDGVQELMKNLWLIICDEILSGKFESIMSHIPPNSDQRISARCIFKE